MLKRVILALTLGLVGTGVTLAAPVSVTLPNETAALKPGPGHDLAQSNCSTCHSLDYINSQPPKKGRPFWDAEVQKMIKTFGATIGESDAKTIADYLGETY
jgi:sulfite dehydrogenase (cytochrome) subunit B